ncbi:hypothetical protein GpartN1_g7023.t1 [Galdieria partita]|uniref:Uncharacterized protein n=1 Tax=Galdieria partita TaxID=83374 RepID=A0A9C7UU22_9RHOD|nr:hypothetical protein GpartN1_g7023.t1 [Galdieria partita]
MSTRLSLLGITASISLVLFLYGLVHICTHYGIFSGSQQRGFSPLYTGQPSSVSISQELEQIAKSQLQPWIGYQMNQSDVKDYAKRKEYLYVVEIKNGTLHIPEYVDKEFEYNQNVEPLVTVIQQILKEENNIQDTFLFLNLLDEPRNPNKVRCQQTGMWNKIEKYHGFPLSLIEESKDMPWFPILSPAKISDCFEDILVPFGDLLEPLKLEEMRKTTPTCEKWNTTKRLMTALFRGSPTGHSFKEGRNHRLALIKACDNEQSRYLRNYLAHSSSMEDLLSLFPEGGPLCDAALTHQVDLNISDVSSPIYFLPMKVWEEITFFCIGYRWQFLF